MRNQTNVKKYVLTGGPGIGKTTVLEILASRGYTIVPEASRYVIEEEQSKDGDALPWKNQAKFQKRVMEQQLILEEGISGDIAFLDRGIVDGDGYCHHFGISSPEGIEELGRKRYEKVFVLQRLPEYKNDSVRLEDSKEAEKIHKAVVDAYIRFGYELIMVPVSSPEERIKFILEKI
jgi:predicted ATPase